MKRMREMVLAVGLWTVVLLVGSNTRAADEASFSEQQLEQARAIHVQRLKLGAEAVDVLKAHGATPEARTRAALATGLLAYTPAIPVLIQRIDLRNTAGRSTEADIGLLLPCVRALADMRVAAVPALVDAYVAESQNDRRELIRKTIVYGKAYDEARTYAQGLISTTANPERRKVLDVLLGLIPKEERAGKKE